MTFVVNGFRKHHDKAPYKASAAAATISMSTIRFPRNGCVAVSLTLPDSSFARTHTAPVPPAMLPLDIVAPLATEVG